MLQEKTKGNLSTDEQRSLDNSITELRFRFVQAREQYAQDQAADDTVPRSATGNDQPA